MPNAEASSDAAESGRRLDNATAAAVGRVTLILAGGSLVVTADDAAEAGWSCCIGADADGSDESESGMRKSGVAGAESDPDRDNNEDEEDDDDDEDADNAEGTVASVAALKAEAILAAETFNSMEVIGVDLTAGDGKCNERATAGSGVSDTDWAAAADDACARRGKVAAAIDEAAKDSAPDGRFEAGLRDDEDEDEDEKAEDAD